MTATGDYRGIQIFVSPHLPFLRSVTDEPIHYYQADERTFYCSEEYYETLKAKVDKGED